MITTADRLEFDSASHTYRLDGDIVPSVTQILHGAGLIDTRWFTEGSALRGQHVAEAIQYDIEGDLGSCPEIILPYLIAWRKFQQHTGIEVIACEELVFDPIRRYAGKLDIRGMLNGREWVIDIKSGVYQAWHSLQTSGYARTFNRPLLRGTLYVNAEEKCTLRPHTGRTDEAAFLAALTLHNWRKDNNV